MSPLRLLILVTLFMSGRDASRALGEASPRYALPTRGMLLQGIDVLTTPGEELVLTAQLSRILAPGRFEPVYRRKIYFSLNGDRLGHSLTSTTGGAGIKHAAGQAGDYNVRLSTSRRDSVKINDGNILLRVTNYTSFLMLVDVEKTLHDVSSMRFPFTPNEQVPPFPHAKEALEQLSELRQLVYISSSNGMHIRKIKYWLEQNGMPSAPVLCWDLPAKSDESARVKAHHIRELIKTFPNVMGGIGNRAADAKACHANSVSSYIISSSGETEKSELSHSFSDWSELKKYITAHARQAVRSVLP